MAETITRETASYGGFADAIGGIATIVLAIIGLAGVHPQMLVSIATIVFGVALLIEGGTMLSEYVSIIFPASASGATADQFSGNSLSAVFLVGAAGIVLGVLAVLGIHAETLTAISLIAFGTALVLSSNAVWRLHMLKHAAMLGSQTETPRGGEIIASEMAAGSAGMQALAGLAAGVLGILALVGTGVDSVVLILVALLALGAALMLTGGALTGTVMGFMKEETSERYPTRTSPSTGSPPSTQTYSRDVSAE
jgi:hypothetical protein